MSECERLNRPGCTTVEDDHLDREDHEGFKTLLALLNGDLSEVFGSEGVLLYVQLSGLARMEHLHGHQMRAVCLQEFAHLINQEVMRYKGLGIGTVPCHLGGEAYLVRFDRMEESQVRNQALRLRKLLGNAMRNKGVDDTGMRFGVWTYHTPFSSVSDLLKRGSLCLNSPWESGAHPDPLPHWADMMVDSMTGHVKETLRQSLRHQDRVFRWLSGGEFLVLLYGEDRETAMSLSGRIRIVVQQQTQSWRYPVQVSVGMATYPLDAMDLDSLIHKAENANVRGRRTRENRVR